MLKRTLLTTAAATLIAFPAFAADPMKSNDTSTMDKSTTGQSTTGQSTTGQSTTGQSSSGTTAMDKPASLSARPEFLTRQSASDVRAEQLIGTKVINAKSEEIGSIDDLVVSKDNGIVAAVISVGGFLGVGDKLVAVNAQSITFHQTKDNELVAMLDKTKADLEAAPAFEKTDATVIENMKSMLRDDDTGKMSK